MPRNLFFVPKYFLALPPPKLLAGYIPACGDNFVKVKVKADITLPGGTPPQSYGTPLVI